MVMGIWFCLASPAVAQNCPAGIPSGGNPHCIPPDRPESPYYNGSKAYINSAPSPQPIVVQTRWADRWGAIAADGLAGALGFAVGFPTKRDAEHAAMSKCRNEGGGKCTLDLSFRNGCAVFMLGSKMSYTASAADMSSAKKYGMQLCGKADNNCRVYESACSMAEVEPM